MFFQVFLLIASVVIQSALAPKPEGPKAASLGDFNVPTASEGGAIAVIFGTAFIRAPNVVWFGALNKVAIKTKKGKK